jgi:DNA mismatch repair protein MutS2
LESLEPTYHLTIGLPGRSNALSIAQRLGLSQEVVERARGSVSPDDLRAETLLDEIHHQRDIARREREVMQHARQQAQAKQADLSDRLEQIEDERREILAAARAEAQQELEALQGELRKLRQRLAMAGQPLAAVDTLEREVEELGAESEQPVERRVIESPERREFRLGDRVYLKTISTDGVITGLDEDQAEVQVGRLRVRTQLEELGAPRQEEVKSGEKVVGRKRSAQAQRTGEAPAVPAPPLELDLRGSTVEEALEALEYRLDSAYLAALPYVRVIHGKGTGRLRQAVREALGGNRYVQSFEPGKPSQGGDGVTVVRLSTR